jgi:hypothetical protein
MSKYWHYGEGENTTDVCLLSHLSHFFHTFSHSLITDPLDPPLYYSRRKVGHRGLAGLLVLSHFSRFSQYIIKIAKRRFSKGFKPPVLLGHAGEVRHWWVTAEGIVQVSHFSGVRPLRRTE